MKKTQTEDWVGVFSCQKQEKQKPESAICMSKKYPTLINTDLSPAVCAGRLETHDF